MRVEQIKSQLIKSLNPVNIEVVDNSHAHAGHAGVQNGGGHYHVTIVSDEFTGKSLVKRHQLIYQVLDKMMKHEIHALGIDALTPSEFSKGDH